MAREDYRLHDDRYGELQSALRAKVFRDPGMEGMDDMKSFHVKDATVRISYTSEPFDLSGRIIIAAATEAKIKEALDVMGEVSRSRIIPMRRTG